MPDTFQLICPECGLQYQLDRAMIGAKVKCTECGVKFIAHDTPPEPPPTESVAEPPQPEESKPAPSQNPQATESPVAQEVVQPAEKKEVPPPPKSEPKPASKPEPKPASEPKPKPPESKPPEPKEPTSHRPQSKSQKNRRRNKRETAPPKSEPSTPPKSQSPPPNAEQPKPEPRPERKSAPQTPHPDAKHFAAVENIASAHSQVLSEVGKVIIGQRDVIDQVLTAFFARGNCLLKGVPGLAKTLLVNTLADSMALQFHRIQFTPDLMPTDITGTNILEEDPTTGKRIFTFRKGPVFTNLLLADEINRTPPKTQAALLEAMQEKQVTSGEQLYKLPDPFLVLATQNPIEQEGTYTLPEAQLDRFIFMVNVGYPNEEEELQILLDTTRDKVEKIEHVLDADGIIKIQQVVRSIPVTEHVAGYAARLVRATRPEDPTAPDFIKNWLHYGCGPRAGQSLLLAAKAHAAMSGRITVACDDIRTYALPTLRHRVVLNFAAAAEGLTPDDVINKLLDHVKERPGS